MGGNRATFSFHRKWLTKIFRNYSHVCCAVLCVYKYTFKSHIFSRASSSVPVGFEKVKLQRSTLILKGRGGLTKDTSKKRRKKERRNEKKKKRVVIVVEKTPYFFLPEIVMHKFT